MIQELTIKQMRDHLVDLNSSEVPERVMAEFWDIKKDLGSYPLGIAKLPEDGWYIHDTSGKVHLRLDL